MKNTKMNIINIIGLLLVAGYCVSIYLNTLWAIPIISILFVCLLVITALLRPNIGQEAKEFLSFLCFVFIFVIVGYTLLPILLR